MADHMHIISINKLEGILKFIANDIDSGVDGNKNNKIDDDEYTIFIKEAGILKDKGLITESDYNSIFDNVLRNGGLNIDSFESSRKFYCPQDNTRVVANVPPVTESKTKNRLQKLKFDPDFEFKLTEEQIDSLENVKKAFIKNKQRYKSIEKETGVPAELICAIHYRESGNNFGTYLHNGQKLGRRTTVKPKGKFFTNWESATVDAIKSNPYYKNVKIDDYDSQLEYAERYNGTGYRKHGHVSPYVYSGTDKYTGGKYVRDGRFNPNVVDEQVGVAAILYVLYNT